MESQNQLQPTEKNNNEFWKKHYETQKASKLSRAMYCRQHALNYDRFWYWIKKQKSPISNKLIAVKLKQDTSLVQQKTLCTLDLKNGHSLKIHDPQALSLILERYQ